ncbi:cupin domain-containing protein [Mucilaginibacter arboris]|uniref:Cupin domain-containing protein n=1 Tax=Mucilaginibacter arboris TaxID=2682090 RepID=A0A7K1T1X8_9SPHI|nr:cupin domain-containing protein [Mucilaginibacter arboris]MVN23527.1 cupin domain-containing protein [Mucilaginibacter arboris]
MSRTIVNPVLKEAVTFVKTADETNGAVSDLEITIAAGGGNPLHYHTTYTEKFTAIEGELHLELKHKRIVRLKPGESYLVKKGEVHRFFNAGEAEIKFRNEVHPGHKGFENTLRILHGLAADGLYNDKGVPKNLTHLAVCGIMSDMRLPGLMSLTTPLLKFIAARARKKGIEQQLLEKYCK